MIAVLLESLKHDVLPCIKACSCRCTTEIIIIMFYRFTNEQNSVLWTCYKNGMVGVGKTNLKLIEQAAIETGLTEIQIKV